MNLHFQVVSLDSKGYIKAHRDFIYEQLNIMIRYISKECTANGVQEIKITRWNDKGEKE